jgi:hypothetical protein
MELTAPPPAKTSKKNEEKKKMMLANKQQQVKKEILRFNEEKSIDYFAVSFTHLKYLSPSL